MAGQSNTPDPPENEESLKGLRLRAQSEVIQEELDALEDHMKALDQVADSESISTKTGEAGEEKREGNKAPLEKRSDVASKDRLNYRLNYTEQRRLERGEEALREDEFSQTWRGRLSKSPMTRWLFDQRTRKLQVVIVLGLLVALLGVVISFALSQHEVQTVDQVQEEDTKPIPKLGNELLEGREASEEIIRQFYQADSIEALLPLIRRPELMRPLME